MLKQIKKNYLFIKLSERYNIVVRFTQPQEEIGSKIEISFGELSKLDNTFHELTIYGNLPKYFSERFIISPEETISDLESRKDDMRRIVESFYQCYSGTTKREKPRSQIEKFNQRYCKLQQFA